MKKIAVLDDYDGSISKLTLWKELAGEFEIHFFSQPILPDDIKSFEVVVATRERTKLTASYLAKLESLKHLALTGRLSGQADLETLKKRAIATSFTDGSGAAPAELTIALLLAITKRVHDRHLVVRQGGWQIGPSQTLGGKTLGILGLGRMGTQVAQFGKLIGMKVISWGPTEDKGRSANLGIERLPLEECLKESDALCICLRLSEKTKGLLHEEQLGMLKTGSALVNTSRAEIIDKDALYSELKKNRIWAALDVFYNEPLPIDDPLRTFPNVLLSPHMGYVTNEVYESFYSQVVENIQNWNKGAPYRNALI